MGYGIYENIGDLSLRGMQEEDIVELAKGGDSIAVEYLIKKYNGFIHGKARTYFLVGADRDDVFQEGMIGLFKAVRDYDRDKLASFKFFAEMCISRQIITAVKTATRQKHIPLNSYVSLNKPLFKEDSDSTLMDMIEGVRITDPMEVFIGTENVSNMEDIMAQVLSELEWEVVNSYIRGKSYQEIAEDLERTEKSIDNALQRVKKKLEKLFLP